MLLAYIDDLVNSKVTYAYSFQIYQTLIDKWIERESNRVSYQERDNFREQLYKFSKIVAINLYEQQQTRGGLFISSEEIEQFATENRIVLSQLDLRSRSLLNRNSAGEYKFSHKSILEYFLAIELLKNDELRRAFNYESVPMTKEFYREMCNKEMLARAVNLNTSIPFNQTVHLGIRKYLDGNNLGLQFNLKKQRTITILNLADIDEYMLAAFSEIEYLNVLVSRFEDLEKLFGFKKLKAVCLLNECETVLSAMKAISVESDHQKVNQYITDLKLHITNLAPSINIDSQLNKFEKRDEVTSELTKQRGYFGFLADSHWKKVKDVQNIKGTSDAVTSELYFIYTSYIIPFLRKTLTEGSHSKGWTFYKLPLDIHGKLLR